MSKSSDWLLAGGVVGAFVYVATRQRKKAEAAEGKAEEYREIAHVMHGEAVKRGAADPPETKPTPKPTKPNIFRYDEIFAKHGDGIPVAYLRALAIGESDLDPRNVTHRARGLLQIIPSVRKDFNDRHPSRRSVTEADLFRPDVSVEICAWVLRHYVMPTYAEHHPEIPNLQEDWSNLDFVGLLTLGWNCGWSSQGGVSDVVGSIKKAGIRHITIYSVQKMAAYSPKAKKLQQAAPYRWCQDVVDRYARFREEEAAILTAGKVAGAGW
jgi:hypothetical protein